MWIIWIYLVLFYQLLRFYLYAAGLQSVKISTNYRLNVNVHTFWVLKCDVRYDFRIEKIFGSPLHPVVCMRLMSYLRCLCLFAHNGVQRILCCVFVLLDFVFWLPDFLDGPFLIDLSVLFNVYFISVPKYLFGQNRKQL
jgi:hypothetical protein